MHPLVLSIRPAYIALPRLGEVWLERSHRRGRTFFDTDLDLRPQGLAEGIELFAGHWSVSLGVVRPLTTATARLVWFSVAAPVLTVAAVAKSLALSAFPARIVARPS